MAFHIRGTSYLICEVGRCLVQQGFDGNLLYPPYLDFRPVALHAPSGVFEPSPNEKRRDHEPVFAPRLGEEFAFAKQVVHFGEVHGEGCEVASVFGVYQLHGDGSARGVAPNENASVSVGSGYGSKFFRFAANFGKSEIGGS